MESSLSFEGKPSKHLGKDVVGYFVQYGEEQTKTGEFSLVNITGKDYDLFTMLKPVPA